MIFPDGVPPTTPVGDATGAGWLADEEKLVREFAAQLVGNPDRTARIADMAAQLVTAVRAAQPGRGTVDAFLHEYDLSSREGVILMCLAEGLLRIPDAATADRLIEDLLPAGAWDSHLATDGSLLVNASTWALLLTGRLVDLQDMDGRRPLQLLGALVGRIGEPVVRRALRAAMRILAGQFVMGETIAEALARAVEQQQYRYSFDMLGEAALTITDAQRYLAAYHQAIVAIGSSWSGAQACRPGVSVKLSALHPRFELSQGRRARHQIGAALAELLQAAAAAGVQLTVDAEEAERLELTLAIFADLSRQAPDFASFGIAVQAYQRRAPQVIAFLDALARQCRRPIPVRLVKGAYWDTEIKRAQQQALASYPVYTRKVNTDVAYLACAQQLLAAGDSLFPQFATHNGHTIAWLLAHAPDHDAWEFQRLHGMGESLYAATFALAGRPVACRVYAPVGRHEELLPYLVRRLLENGANTSFINRIQDRALKIAAVIADPVTTVTELPVIPNPAIPAPRNVHGAAFESAPAPNLADTVALAQLAREISAAAATHSTARPTTPRAPLTGGASRAVNPADATDSPGTVEFADNAAAGIAFALAASAWPDWERREVAERAALLRRAADRLVEHRGELLALLVREAGKCVPDAVAEWREAVELLRYYATEAERVAGSAVRLAGPTGELNELALRGRGTFVCISPWNFPLAIFTGQVGAALVAGNCVIAKPSEQACLVAARAVAVLHAAGIPADVLQCLPGDGPTLGTALVADPRAAGVAFTGSVSAAQSIARTLAGRDAALGTLIAETGGINAMIVDSSALPEQVVPDVLQSAFNSAGQRCSALRILCLQRDIADAVIERLRGAMDQLVIGDPRWLATDIGPLIDQAALKSVEEYLAKRRTDILHRCALPAGLADGNWCPPAVLSINAIAEVTREIFGPVLHVLRFDGPGLARLIEDINAAGYGLTLGVHSRIGSRAREVAARALAGNVYVNRNMIGAMAGSQPFGGRGLSGTGPKAGGPGYLPRFMTEQTLTINTAAVGGNATLLSGG